MKRFSLLAFGLTALSLVARAEEAPSTTEPVTIFIRDKDDKQVDTKGMSAMVTFAVPGTGIRRTGLLNARAAGDPAAQLPPVEHGGQVVTTTDGMKVELVVGWSAGKQPDAPCFEGNVTLKAWACPMACEAPADKAGTCSKCKMSLELSYVEMTAAVKIKGINGDQELTGFAMPTPLPTTWADAVKEAKIQSGQALKGTAVLPRVRRIRRLCDGLVELASADQKDAVKAKAKTIRTACDEAEKATLAGQDASEPLGLIDKKVSSLPAEGGGK
jgi:hypothetical protein